MKVCFVVLICGILTASALGQSSPSLASTLEFLSGIVKQSGTVGNVDRTVVDEDKFESDKCVVTITHVNRTFGAKGEPQGSTTIVDTFSMRDMDPTSVVTTEFSDDMFPDSSSVQFDATDFKTVVTREAVGEKLGTANSGIKMDSQAAPRFAEALKHAIVLCGGKASAF